MTLLPPPSSTALSYSEMLHSACEYLSAYREFRIGAVVAFRRGKKEAAHGTGLQLEEAMECLRVHTSTGQYLASIWSVPGQYLVSSGPVLAPVHAGVADHWQLKSDVHESRSE